MLSQHEGKEVTLTILLLTGAYISILQHCGGWKRYYDPVTSHTFYYDEFSGDCVHDTCATSAFLTGIRKPRPKSRFALTKEELQRRKEEEEWRSALQRARRQDERVKEVALQAELDVQRSAELDDELQKAIQKLEMSVTSEHLNVNGKGLAYVDARYRRELEIYLKARKDGLLTSIDPARESARDEIERSEQLDEELDEQEQESAAIEDTDSNRASRERRRVSRLLCRTIERMKFDQELCRWGCERWFPRAMSLESHERDECHRRRMVCRLGCALVLEHQRWKQMIYEHEDEHRTHCDSRISYCPRDCGVWIPHLRLEHHMHELCMKRPVGDLLCRLGCGKIYQGGAHQLLALEQARIAHEQDDCELRKVECTWPKCRAIIVAKERNAHRRDHLISSGVVSFLTADVHEYKVPKDMKLLKIQAWGAGGGSGHLKGQMVGHGGGGAFVEGICKVFPGETLYISIGSGGSSGKYARLQQCEYECEDDQRHAPPTGNGDAPAKRSKRIETLVGVAKGGHPGGGSGHSGNKECACGGGGGFTSVYRESAFGIEYLMIAAGGGGGGTCRHGDGGGAPKARKLNDGDDVRIGRPGGDVVGGAAGECDAHNPICRFLATDGVSMQGGDGAEFGGGGGGGLFGGGGGGFAPGIVGGGGGGSSFVNTSLFDAKSVHVEPGDAILPGGMDQNPPQSVRGAYWDVVDGVAGEGGTSTVTSVENGNHGGVRLARPGFFNDMKFHR